MGGEDVVGEVKGVDELGVKSCVQGRTLSHLVRLQGIDNRYNGLQAVHGADATPRRKRLAPHRQGVPHQQHGISGPSRVARGSTTVQTAR
jgi:hypothetical protein